MKLILKRHARLTDIVFGTLQTTKGDEICHTLEPLFPSEGGGEPKVPLGEYQCVRGVHNLAHGDPFETFEVMHVPGHWGILFHSGNWRKDSDGCILVGEEIANNMLRQSRLAFLNFLTRLNNIDSFYLTVIEG